MANQELVHTESIPGLMRGILTDLRTLIREEIALARVEINAQVGRARGTAILLFSGTVFAWKRRPRRVHA